MTLSNRALACVALGFALNLLSLAAFGGVMDYGTPYTDGSSVTWSGTSHFEHPSGLEGNIDWIVYGPGQFPYGDSGYLPPAGQFTYAYQVENTGTVSITDLTVSVNQAIANVDDFVSPGRVTGDLAPFIDFVSGSGGFAEWGFDGINVGNTSAGLAFTSFKAPTYTTGRVIDGGSYVGGISLPGPGTYEIPEPCTLTLLFLGLGLVAASRRFSRR